MLFSLFHFEACLVEENAEYVFICFNLISDVISIKKYQSLLLFEMSYDCVMFCTIWYHLYNFKNVKITHGGVLLLVEKLQAFSFRLY